MQISRHDENVVEALNGGDAPVLSEWHGKRSKKVQRQGRLDFGLRGNDWAYYSVKPEHEVETRPEGKG
jgi:hypothetical protein